MKPYKDIWADGNFLPFALIQRRYGLLPGEIGAWQAAMTLIRRTWRELLLKERFLFATHGDWYGLYENLSISRLRLGLEPLTFCSLLSPGVVFNRVMLGLLTLGKEASRLPGNIACLVIGCLGDIVKLVDCGSYLEVLSFGCSGPKGTKLPSMVSSGHLSS